MKLTQTQFALSSLSPNVSYKGLICFSIFLIAGTALYIYLKTEKTLKYGPHDVNQKM